MTMIQRGQAAARLGRGGAGEPERLYAAAEPDFARYEVVKDVVDECIDLSLNYRQSGHPGGSRSKVHLLLALLLSGAMRWDIRRPWLRFGDRFVLAAGHTVPLIYATLAVLNEGLRARHDATGDPRFAFPDDGRWALTWEWLLRLRHRGGLPGHAEFEGRNLFCKYNTGPSGHGLSPATGEALALKRAGAEEVKVFTVEGEGGLTPGGAHEAKHTAWGLGLSNLVFLLDWNDFGIDPRPLSSVVYGTPEDWFAPYGWRVLGTEHGMQWENVTRTVLEGSAGENPGRVPTVAWFKTVKGRGYGKEGAPSHGTPWPMNAPQFWAVRKAYMARYGVEYAGVDEAAPVGAGALHAQAEANLRTAVGVLRRDTALVEWLSDRLTAIADTVPGDIGGFALGRRTVGVFTDARLLDCRQYPEQMWKKPGEKAPNRAALATWGAYVNTLAKRDYGRPLFIACSADLAESTNIAGFGKDFGDLPGFGWYERDTNPAGALLPTQIFPRGHVIDLHPWEYNEVPVMLAAALSTDAPIVALHLTRPSIEIPDREALGLPSHFAAARGAYLLREFHDGSTRAGTVYVRGTIATRNLVGILPELDRRGINVKVVAALSPQLLARQDREYRDLVNGPADRVDAMVVTNGGFKLMQDWAGGPLVREYSLSPDWDDRWRTGGTVDEVIEEAHLDADHILAAIERFAADRPRRLAAVRAALESAER
jgi:transketolase